MAKPTAAAASIGLFSTVAVDNEWADYLFVHEFGHHFAGLADEYYTSPVAYQPAAQVVEPWQANVTALLDGAPLKWRDLVAADTPLPTPWPKAEFEARQREFQARRKQTARREPPGERDERRCSARSRPSMPGCSRASRLPATSAPSGAPTTTRRPTTVRSSIA